MVRHAEHVLHKKAFVLSCRIIGSEGDTPKVACPLHKKTFSLASGGWLSDEHHALETFPVLIEGEDVSSRYRRRSCFRQHWRHRVSVKAKRIPCRGLSR